MFERCQSWIWTPLQSASRERQRLGAVLGGQLPATEKHGVEPQGHVFFPCHWLDQMDIQIINLDSGTWFMNHHQRENKIQPHMWPSPFAVDGKKQSMEQQLGGFRRSEPEADCFGWFAQQRWMSHREKLASLGFPVTAVWEFLSSQLRTRAVQQLFSGNSMSFCHSSSCSADHVGLFPEDFIKTKSQMSMLVWKGKHSSLDVSKLIDVRKYHLQTHIISVDSQFCHQSISFGQN